jgi:MFS transporter, AAHS family, 4-hydroxybenzoate transporter
MSGAADLGRVIENQRAGWFQKSLMFWIALTMVIEGNDNQVAGYAAPAMIQALHIDRARFGAVFGLGLLGYMAGALVLGAAADRLGRRRLVIAGAFCFGVFTLATAYVDSLRAILALRFLAGIGLGAAVPSSVALMAEYAPKSARATRVALMFVAYTIGAALGGLAAAWLIPRFGWQGVYELGGWSGIVLALCLAFTLPESARFLLVNQDRLPRARERLARIVRRLDPTVTATRFVSDDTAEPGVPVRHLFTDGRTPRTLLLWTAYAGTQMTLVFMTSWLPTVIHQGGLSLTQAEITTTLLQAGGAVGSFAFGRLLDRRGVIALAAGFLAGAPVVALLGIADGSAPLLMLLAALAGFCISGGQAGVNALSGTIYPTHMRATGSGWAFGIGRVGSILGPIIGGVLLGLEIGPRALFLCVAVPALCVAAALLGLKRVAGNHPQREDAPPPIGSTDHVRTG